LFAWGGPTVSATVMQRVVVRMLFDAAFRDCVYADAAVVLHDLDLTPEERQWLVTPDPRAYGTDAYRRSRALSGLLEEYPVAGALAIRCPQGAQQLHRFFASTLFHQCVQQRGSMADAFGCYLGSPAFAGHPEITHLAEVERGIAQVRRASDLASNAPHALTETSRLYLAPWVALLLLPPTTLARYGRVRDHLAQRGATLLDAVLDSEYGVPAGPPLDAAEAAFVLVVGIPGEDGPALEPTSHELGTLLAAAQAGMVCRDLCTVAVRLGAEPPEACEIIQGLVADRLLIQVP
jgi:hypothetical protein